ncbi:MAG: thiolase family protein [Deltaproteobacteria bacterium]|nr:thiolase family protein [Deltaproteobacteria bacterium]
MNQVIVASAVRTPIGAFCGQFETLSEQQLGAVAMQEAVKRAGIPAEQIEEVIVGIAKQTSRPSNGGRHAMLLARLPEKVPAYTVQRQSASGFQAVVNGYWAIRCGDAGVILAGGTESMSQIPFEIRNARYAFDGKRREIIDAIPAQETGAQPAERYGFVTTAGVAENLARKYLLLEEELAAFAESSLKKAHAAGEGSSGEGEIFPVTVKKGKKEETIRADELQRKAPLLAPPADGAAMCLLASREKADALALPVLAEIISVGTAATDPRYTGLAVVEASRCALSRAGLNLNEVEVIELNEMSAAECLAVLREWQSWGVAPDVLAKRVNPAGGALATGNPWGAMGAVLLTRAVHALRHRSARIAMVALGAEGGQGMALVLRNSG